MSSFAGRESTTLTSCGIVLRTTRNLLSSLNSCLILVRKECSWILAVI